MLRTFVSFEADWPHARDSQPYGKQFAEWLAPQLVARGLPVSGPEACEDYAWYFRFEGPGVDVGSLFALIDDGVRMWGIHSYSSRGWKAFFRGMDVEPVIRPYLQAMDEVLRSDSRIHNIRWYTKKEWDSDPENLYSDHP